MFVCSKSNDTSHDAPDYPNHEAQDYLGHEAHDYLSPSIISVMRLRIIPVQDYLS